MAALLMNRFIAPTHQRRARPGQAASLIPQVFSMIRLGIEPIAYNFGGV